MFLSHYVLTLAVSQEVLHPRIKSGWTEARDDATDEIVYHRRDRVFYPLRNYGSGEMRSKSGRLIQHSDQNLSQIHEDEDLSSMRSWYINLFILL